MPMVHSSAARGPAEAGRPARRRRAARASPDDQLHRELAEQLSGLPRDLAVALISMGAAGVVIPGPVPLGLSFLVLGTVVLWPGLLVTTGGPLARRCPRVFRVLVDFAEDLRTDLERRYPGSLKGGISRGGRGRPPFNRPGRASSGRDA